MSLPAEFRRATKLLVDLARGCMGLIVAKHQLDCLQNTDRCVGRRDDVAAFSGPVDLPKIRTLLG